jgi:hypothetical protein
LNYALAFSKNSTTGGKIKKGGCFVLNKNEATLMMELFYDAKIKKFFGMIFHDGVQTIIWLPNDIVGTEDVRCKEFISQFCDISDSKLTLKKDITMNGNIRVYSEPSKTANQFIKNQLMGQTLYVSSENLELYDILAAAEMYVVNISSEFKKRHDKYQNISQMLLDFKKQFQEPEKVVYVQDLFTIRSNTLTKNQVDNDHADFMSLAKNDGSVIFNPNATICNMIKSANITDTKSGNVECTTINDIPSAMEVAVFMVQCGITPYSIARYNQQNDVKLVVLNHCAEIQISDGTVEKLYKDGLPIFDFILCNVLWCHNTLKRLWDVTTSLKFVGRISTNMSTTYIDSKKHTRYAIALTKQVVMLSILAYISVVNGVQFNYSKVRFAEADLDDEFDDIINDIYANKDIDEQRVKKVCSILNVSTNYG